MNGFTLLSAAELLEHERKNLVLWEIVQTCDIWQSVVAVLLLWLAGACVEQPTTLDQLSWQKVRSAARIPLPPYLLGRLSGRFRGFQILMKTSLE